MYKIKKKVESKSADRIKVWFLVYNNLSKFKTLSKIVSPNIFKL